VGRSFEDGDLGLHGGDTLAQGSDAFVAGRGRRGCRGEED
jgi:hypothetical protein